MLFDNRIEAGGGYGGHIEHAADGVSASFAESFSGRSAGITSKRGDADKCGDLTIGKDAEFGQIGYQRRAQCGADAGDRLQQKVRLSPGFAFFDPGTDLGIGVLDLALQEANMVPDALLS